MPGRTPTSLLVAAGLLLSGCGSASEETRDDTRSRAAGPSIAGTVVSASGAPVAGARVVARDQETRSDARGRFRLTAAKPSWVTVEQRGFMPRTRAGFPGDPLFMRLTPDDGRTASLTFGGDVMFGRRFYERGALPEAYLDPASGPREHARLLEDVAPLLRASDLTMVNLETPLIERPHFIGRRPRRFHPTKEFAFASAPASAAALRQVGVDVVGLANNHLYDALQPGVDRTVRVLERTGFQRGAGYFGAGPSRRAAWEPAVAEAGGQKVAVVGCTSIEGYEHRIAYVATQTQGGAAACEEGRIRRTVARLKRRYDIVVMMVHGGFEYVRRPSMRVRRYSVAARRAGAALVMNHHPHVVGGLQWDDRTLTAWTLGNLLFDQTVWPTFQSYLLTVHVREGRVVRAHTESLSLEDYMPRAIGGRLAEPVAREAAGREAGPFVMEDGAVEVDIDGTAKVTREQVAVRAPASGRVLEVGSGWAVGHDGDGRVEGGRDLLWLGSFEDPDIDDDDTPEAMWTLGGAGAVTREAAARGRYGLELSRNSRDRGSAVAAPRHRLLLEPGRRLTITGDFRGSPAAMARVRLSFYRDTKGRSSSFRVRRLGGTGRWRPFRLDLTVPPKTVAVGLYLKLEAPESGDVAAQFDDLRVIQWAPLRERPSALPEYVRARGAARLTLENRRLPGGPPPGASRLTPVGGR